MSVTPKAARDLALSLPEAEEAPHFELTSFRVRGKIFATLGADRPLMVKLTRAEQDIYRGMLEAIEPVPGAWGQKGSTFVHLDRIAKEDLRALLTIAWRNVAPKALVAAHAARLTGAIVAKPKLAPPKPAKAKSAKGRRP